MRDDPHAQTRQCDEEHRVQLELFDAVCRSLAERPGDAATGELIEQLLAHSEAHFASEHLLMRLSSDPALSAHDAEHDRFIETLRRLSDDWGAAQRNDLLARARSLRATVGHHIASRDREFIDHHRRWLARAADPSAPAAD